MTKTAKMINRDNYEQFLVDFAEGNLSHKEANNVRAFLLSNPDINDEFEQFQESSVLQNKQTFKHKELLKTIPETTTKSDSQYFDELCIGNIEKINTKDENNLLEKLIAKDKKKAAILSLYKNTIFSPSIIILDDKLLFKQPPFRHEINKNNFEAYCIAKSEKWLDIDGIKELNNFIVQNPEFESTLNLYNKLKLTPDNEIVFENKQILKRFQLFGNRSKKIFAYVSSVAAILVFGILFYTVQKTENVNLASTKTIEKIKESNVNYNIKETNNDTPLKKQLQTIVKNPLNISSTIFSPEKGKKNNIKHEEFTINNLIPKDIEKLECPKCITFNDDSKVIIYNYKSETGVIYKGKDTRNKGRADNYELGWKIAQASIMGINRVTNGEMKLNKKEVNNKTKIAFRSKFFSIYTQVNNRN